MNTPQFQTFYARLKRIERIHRQGGGFEAEGTLGQSFYTRLQRRSRRSVLRPVVVMLASVIGTKAVLMASLGTEDYAARLVNLEQGTTVERAGAFLMGMDPITLQLAGWLAPLFGG